MVIEIALRSLAVYLFIVLAIRLFGKRELAQLSITDLVFILLISNSVQNAMVGNDSSLLGGLVAAGTLFVVNFAVGFIFFKSKRLTSFIEGHPLILVYEGKAIQENLAKAQISDEELAAVVREHGVEKIDEVDIAILELDGNISVLSNNYSHKTVKKRRAHRVLSKTA